MHVFNHHLSRHCICEVFSSESDGIRVFKVTVFNFEHHDQNVYFVPVINAIKQALQMYVAQSCILSSCQAIPQAILQFLAECCNRKQHPLTVLLLLDPVLETTVSFSNEISLLFVKKQTVRVIISR